MAVEGIPGLIRWAPFTSFKAGERFAAPNGDIVTANIDFTSGATYSATNVTPSAQDGRIGALEVLGGISPGNTSDAAVAGLLNSATNTRNALDARYVNESDAASLVTGMVTAAGTVQTALDSRYVNETDAPGMVTAAGAFQTALDARFAPTAGGKPVGKGELFYNAKDYGVVGGGVVDDTAKLNEAAAAVYAIDPKAILFIPPGKYKITGQVNVRCQLQATGSVFQYTGIGDALAIGSTVLGTVTFRNHYYCPDVINMSRGNAGWDGSSRGVVLYNLNDCYVDVPFVQDFENGLVLSGNNAGNAYNKVMVGSLWENHKNLVLENAPSGYTNQNLFIGGRLQHSTTKGAVLDDVNACQIYMVSTNGEGGPNNNTFINTSLEGENVAFYRVDIAGAYNTFYNCRWESPGGVQPRIRYRASALKNKIHGGYGLFNCVEVFDGTQGGGEIIDSEGAYTTAQNTAAQVIPHNIWTDITTWSTPTQRRCSYNAATGEFTPRPGRWEINAEVTFAKNSTGRRQAAIIVAGSNVGADEISPGAERTKLKANGEFRFNGAQTFKVQALQTSGADLSLEGTSGYVKVRAKYLGY